MIMKPEQTIPPCGIINVDKPKGITSRQAVNHIQKIVKPAKVGHAGTLDPLATGVLAVCIGRATRLVPYIQNYHKTYIAQFLLGKQSDTDDITGDVIDVSVQQTINQSDVEQLLPQFRGKIQQIPPQFSAIHIQGKRAYELARQGTQVDIPAREVEIFQLELIEFDYPEMTLKMQCGSGTYVRSVGRDIGELLNCGAVMTELIRTEIGTYNVSEAISLDEITKDSWRDFLQPPETAVSALPRINISTAACHEISHGRKITAEEELLLPPETTVALFTTNNKLAALALYHPEENLLAPKNVFL